MRRVLFFLLLLSLVFSDTAFADFNRMMTKRDRDKLALKEGSPEVLYEKINELFLREDYQGVERYATQFLSRSAHSERAPLVEELRDLSRVKMGLTPSHAVPSTPLETHSQPVVVAAPAALRQVALEEATIYSVQVGSFSLKENAKALVDKLTQAHYDAYLSRDAEKPDRIRVRVGKTESYDEARALELRLKKEGYPTKIYP